MGEMGPTANLVCNLLKRLTDFFLILGRTGSTSNGFTSFFKFLGGFEVTSAHDAPWCWSSGCGSGEEGGELTDTHTVCSAHGENVSLKVSLGEVPLSLAVSLGISQARREGTY
jgi:hypothetical protein